MSLDKTRCGLRVGCLSGLILSAFAAYLPAAQAVDNQDITATVTGGGTCTVGVPSGGNAIQLGAAGGFSPTPAIGKEWVGVEKKAFKLQLTNCAGLADTNKTPVIRITGNTLATGGNRLFSTGTNTTGFGVVVYNVPLASAADGDTNKIAVKDGIIAIPGFGKGSAINANTDVDLAAAVACGAAADCAPGKLSPGNIAATVTFSFAYQ